MASRNAVKRLTIEYRSIKESPTPYVDARPSEKDILVWYYVVIGPPDTPFEGGQYLGELRFPADYPFAPPSIRMLTPSGRFQPGAKLCLTMSDFHPETWNPAWNVSTILTGVLSFMCSSEVATGALQSTPDIQREFMKKSVKWNMANPIFQSAFPDVVANIKATVQDYDKVPSITIEPPKASDLVANMGTFRGAAYKEASTRADALEEKHASEKEPAKPVNGDPVKENQGTLFSGPLAYIFAAVILAAVAIYISSR